METICLSNKLLSPLNGTSGLVTFLSECHLVTTPLLCLDGLRVKEQYVIWGNGIPIRKITLILLASIDQSGTTYQRIVWTSAPCLLSSSDENRYTSNWYQVQAEVLCYPPWFKNTNSMQPSTHRLRIIPCDDTLGMRWSRSQPQAQNALARFGETRWPIRVYSPAKPGGEGIHLNFEEINSC